MITSYYNHLKFSHYFADVGEDPTTFTANPTADELSVAINMLVPPRQENVDLIIVLWINALYAFDFDEYLSDFDGSVSAPAVGPSAPPGTHPVTMI